jgi:DNA-binding transcriptional LysR family regulator
MAAISVRQLNLNDLIALDALLSERQVTRAAARLHLTQSAMSHALRRLRDVLGDPLLVRTTAGLVPTQRGHRLARAVRVALDEIDGALRDEVGFVPATSHRTFKIAFVDLVAVPLLVPLARKLEASGPNMRLVVSPLDPAHLVEQLESGELDAAVLGPEPTPGLLRRRVAMDSMVCVLRRDHPALKRWSAAEFSRWPHIGIALPGVSMRFIDDALEAHGHKRNMVVQVPYFEPAIAIAALTSFIFLAPRRLARVLEPVFPIALREPPIGIPETEWTMVWHPRADGDPAGTWLREAITEALATPQPPTPRRRRR